MAADSNFSHNYFEALYNNARQNAIVLMDKEGIITAINPAFTNSFGYKENDLIGKNNSVLFTDEDQSKGLPEKEIANVLCTGVSYDNNYLVNRNKTITWVSGESLLTENNGEPVILKVIQNIHKRKESQVALQRLNDFNESILSSIEDAVIVLDNDLSVIKTNNAFINLFKRRAPDLTSLNFAELVKPYDDNNDLIASIKNAARTKNSFKNKHIEIDTLSGEKRIFDVSCTPLNSSVDDNVLLVIHDITMSKQIEKEREDIMGFVAHELRNPLSNVMLCNEIMGSALHDHNMEVLKDMLERNKNNVMRLNKLIVELYEATKVNSGNLQLEISTFNFGEMIKEAVDMVEILQPDFNIIVKGDGDISVVGDRYRLIQVVTNYLSNGIKYSNGKTDVILSIHRDENSLTVSVRDEGLGISKEQLPYIFERFFRVEKTRSIEGIGLGLYLCHQIIHAHGGTVWAESKKGKGSTFYFSIPLIYKPHKRNLFKINERKKS